MSELASRIARRSALIRAGKRRWWTCIEGALGQVSSSGSQPIPEPALSRLVTYLPNASSCGPPILIKYRRTSSRLDVLLIMVDW